MNSVLLYLVPPAVGAAIGFVTNAIAIKMLFRPLAEKRVFGLRVPFTPGILPRQRRRLAANIGRMVSRELLTESIVRERLRSPQFESLVARSVSGYTDRLLDAPLSSVASAASSLPALPSGAGARNGSDLSRTVASVVDRFVSSDSFAALVRSVVRSAASSLGARTVSELFGGGSSPLPDLEDLFAKLASSLSEPETERRIAETIERFLREEAEAGTPLGAHLPANAAETASRMAELAYPIVADAALRFLEQPNTRREMEAKGKAILRDAILELNMFQRFFVSAGQYDKTLSERMPAIIDGLVERIGETVNDEETRTRLAAAIGRSVENVLAKPMGDALGTLKTDPASLSAAIASRLVAFLSVGAGGRGLKRLIAGLLGRIADEPIERLFRDRLGLDPLALADMAAFALIAYIRAEGPAAVPRLVEEFLSERGEETIGSFLKIDAAEKAAWDALIASKAVSLVDERVSSIIESLDVQKMVSDRIDALDMEDVERIVLDVLADQLKWIDIFGAFLGALMGLFQVFFSIYLSR